MPQKRESDTETSEVKAGKRRISEEGYLRLEEENKELRRMLGKTEEGRGERSSVFSPKRLFSSPSTFQITPGEVSIMMCNSYSYSTNAL